MNELNIADELFAPVAERVLETVANALRTIRVQFGYQFDINHVFRRHSFDQLEKYAPSLAMVAGGTRKETHRTRETNDIITYSRPIEVHYIVKVGGGFDQDTWANLITADVKKCLAPAEDDHFKWYDNFNPEMQDYYQVVIDFRTDRPFNSELYLPRSAGRCTFDVIWKELANDPMRWDEYDAKIPLADVTQLPIGAEV